MGKSSAVMVISTSSPGDTLDLLARMVNRIGSGPVGFRMGSGLMASGLTLELLLGFDGLEGLSSRGFESFVGSITPTTPSRTSRLMAGVKRELDRLPAEVDLAQ